MRYIVALRSTWRHFDRDTTDPETVEYISAVNRLDAQRIVDNLSVIPAARCEYAEVTRRAEICVEVYDAKHKRVVLTLDDVSRIARQFMDEADSPRAA